jgi:hypothetical protein
MFALIQPIQLPRATPAEACASGWRRLALRGGRPSGRFCCLCGILEHLEELLRPAPTIVCAACQRGNGRGFADQRPCRFRHASVE